MNEKMKAAEESVLNAVIAVCDRVAKSVGTPNVGTGEFLNACNTLIYAIESVNDNERRHPSAQ